MAEIEVEVGLKTSFKENKVPPKPADGGRNTMRLVVKKSNQSTETGVNAPYLYDIGVEFGFVAKGERLERSSVTNRHNAHMTSEVINERTVGLHAHEVCAVFERFEAGQVQQPRTYGKLAA